MKFKLFFLYALLQCFFSTAQYSFPNCYTSYISGNVYNQGNQVSKNGFNYKAKYWTNTEPPSADWESLGPCGNPDLSLGNEYALNKRIIGYMPTWNTTYDFNDYDPSKITNVVVAFLEFKTNNSDFNSSDFASIEFTPQSISSVNNVLVINQLLANSHNTNTKVSVAVGGAIDYGFLWLMNKYYDNDTKLQEIAQYIVDYADVNNIDGIDLDMECWWADPAIQGTSDLGGRIRGDKWGGSDEGPHPAGIGLRKLAEKIKVLRPNLLLSAAVFGTSWYGNNYDDTMHSSLDWIGLMTYDFTGSWSATPYGPHTALHKVPLNSYQNQNADNPIYSAEDALEYWQGIATPTWNHDGGFNVPRAKLCVGSPFYGYDFSTPKPDGGNGYIALTYKDIVNQYPNAPMSYDPLDPQNYSGYISESGKEIYYETPQSIKNKYQYISDYGQQGIIVWELTNDLHPSDTNSLLNSLYQESTLASTDFNNKKESLIYSSKNKIYYNLECTNSNSNKIQIYNLLGENIYTINISNSNLNSSKKVDLPKGIYVISHDNFKKKIIIE